MKVKQKFDLISPRAETLQQSVINKLDVTSYLCWSYGGWTSCLESHDNLFQQKCVSRVEEGRAWCTQLQPPISGAILPPEVFQHCWAYENGCNLLSSLRAESLDPFSSVNLQRRAINHPICVLSFPLNPGFTLSVFEPFYLRCASEFVNSNFQRLPDGDTCCFSREGFHQVCWPIPGKRSENSPVICSLQQKSGTRTCCSPLDSQILCLGTAQHLDLGAIHSSCDLGNPQTILSLLGFYPSSPLGHL